MARQLASSGLHRFTPRKLPRQRRSQVVFDRIISTAKTLFEEEGFAYVSTNEIAAKARVSIGSLYQYFANCESIALAVYQEASSRAAATMKRRAAQIMNLPIAQSIPKNIECVFDVFEKDRYALLQLINEIPELRSVSQPFTIDTLLQHPTQMFLEQHFTDVDRTVLARKGYVINKCVIGVVSGYFEEQPDRLSRTAVIAELTEMIQEYLASLARQRSHPRA